MVDQPESCGAFRVSRRSAIRWGAWSVVASTFAPARSQPLLQNGRHQFTELAPARVLSAVTLMDTSGRSVLVGPTPGKVLLVNLWATWCPACRIELPMLERLQSDLASQVKVVAVCMDKNEPIAVAEVSRKLGLQKLSVVIDPAGRLAGGESAGDAPLTLYGMPMTYFITPAGRIAGYLIGSADWASENARRFIANYTTSS